MVKNYMLRVKLSLEEHQCLIAHAKAEGKNISDYARGKLFTDGISQKLDSFLYELRSTNMLQPK
jgi:hypothetical protein